MAFLNFTNPVIIKDPQLPGPGAAGSITPTLGGTVLILRGPLGMGKVKVGFVWEPYSAIEYCQDMKKNGTIVSVSFTNYSGRVVIGTDAAITFKHISGDDVPISDVIGTALDLWNGEIELTLVEYSGGGGTPSPWIGDAG